MAEKSPSKHYFMLREVTDAEKEQYRDSPTQSILKTPTAVFSTVEDKNKNVRRLTFATKGVSATTREGSSDSAKAAGKHNGLQGSSTPVVEVAVSPNKSIRVSPEAWHAHLTYRRRFTDYQNEMVKTDYTYSWLSPFYKKEIVPGFPIRPNMSRPSLKSSKSSDQADGSPQEDFLPFHPSHNVAGSTPLANSPFLAKRWTKLRVSAARRLQWMDQSSQGKTFHWWWLLLLLIFLGVIFGGFSMSSSFSSVPSNCKQFLKDAPAQMFSLVQSITFLTKDFISDYCYSLFIVHINNSAPLLVKKSITIKPIQEKEDLSAALNASLLEELLEREKVLLARLNHLEAALQDINKKEHYLYHLAYKIKSLNNRLMLQPCRRVYRESLHLEHLVHDTVSSAIDTRWEAILSEIHADLDSLNTTAMAGLNASEPQMKGIRGLIEEAIRLYDADRTGKADFALESAGGRVVSTRCTVPYGQNSQPNAAIQPGRALGQCWSFQGEGRLILELSHRIKVTGCSIEHIPRSIHPFGVTSSAPKQFSLLGLNNPEDNNPHLFGTYRYSIDAGEAVQHFPVQQDIEDSFKFVELVVLSNHGNANYTCLYRIRVHGHILGS